jgi:hypothetical protein
MKIQYIGFLICCIAVTSQAQTSNQFAADGKLTEWKIPMREFDQNTGIRYDWKNDSANIYLCLKIDDELTQTRIIRNGFSISVDKKGKKSRENALIYKPEFIPLPPNMNRLNGFEKEIMVFKSLPMMLTLQGFQSYKNGDYDKDSLHSVALALDWDSAKSLIMEYKIPFSEIGYSLDSSKPISLGFILLQLPSTESSPSSSSPNMGSQVGGIGQQGGMNNPGGVGAPGGMGSQGGMNSGMGQTSSSSGITENTEEKKIWIRFKPKNRSFANQ